MRLIVVILFIPLIAFGQSIKRVQWYQKGDSLFIVGVSHPLLRGVSGTAIDTNVIVTQSRLSQAVAQMQ